MKNIYGFDVANQEEDTYGHMTCFVEKGRKQEDR